MPQQYRSPDGTPDRHSTKSAINHVDNVQITPDLSPGQTSHVPSTHDASERHKLLTQSATPDRYCVL